MNEMSAESETAIYEDFSRLIILLCYKVSCLVSLRDKRIAPRLNKVPPVLHKMLKNEPCRDLYISFAEQKERLRVLFSAESIDVIENEFLLLNRDASVPTSSNNISFVPFEASRAFLGLR